MTATRFAVANQRAGIVTRAAAAAVDTIIVFAAIRGTVWFAEALRSLRKFAPPFELAPLLLTVAPLLGGLYNVLFWRFGGQTPGKWLLGVKVVARGGGRVTLARALVRALGYVLSALPLYLGFLWILGPRRRGWHDLLANTEVVYAPRARPPETRRVLPFGGLPAGAS